MGILKIPITRIILLVVTDLFAVMASSALSLYVRYEFSFMSIDPQFWKAIQDAYLLNVFVTLVVFYIFRLYNSVWRYASDTEMVNVVIAVTICAVMQPVIFWLLDTYVPKSFPFFYGFFLALFAGGVRFSYRFLRMVQNKRLNHYNAPERQNYMIGSGSFRQRHSPGGAVQQISEYACGLLYRRQSGLPGEIPAGGAHCGLSLIHI